ncbi:MAG: hypothetical protein KDE26_04595, partial [Bacteroidetes bacterium]|nr:hypothetical protein [Bacteroidota bacterium]
WANRQINNLQNQRDKEINRLLELFKKNPIEALRFALPLNSPYRGRGQGKPGNQLPYQNTDFNLHKLGGGWAADGWDLSHDHYQQLQNLYHEEAKKSLASGEFRRAAYIYAHLLGDYSAAANALEQGKFYREAAVIYKDHLQKTDAAAACLERGGLIPEAIDLYLELNHHEKAGDLSLLIGRKQAAQNLYQTAFEKAINRDDYLDAVRILKEKLNQEEKIPETLLKGWQISSRKETCLNQYFDFVAEKDPESLPESVREIFDTHTRPDQRIAFLNVLKETRQKYNSPELTNTTEEIVFEVISHDISQGNLGTIEFLAAFIPHDKLMFSDISRYKYLHKNHTPKPVVQSELLGLPLQRYSLDPTINWMAIDKNYQSMIAVGMKNNLLYAAVSKEDQTKYYSWPNHISEKTKWKLFSNPFQQSSYIILAGHPDPGIISLPIGEGILSKPLELTHYNWMTHLTYSICVREDSIVILSQNQGNNRIFTYHFDNNLFSSFPIEFNEGLQPRKDFLPHRMQSIRGNYYTANGSTLFCFYGEGDKQGKFHYLHFSSLIKDFIAIPGPQISFIVCTEEGCFTVEESNLGFHLTSEIFARQTEIVDIQRISLNSIVIAGRNEILLYQIYTDVQKEPELIKHFWVQENIQAVMPTKQRGQITVFTEEGEVVFY